MTLKECNTLRWNIDKINKAIEDKKQMNKVYNAVYTEGFVSSKDLKERFRNVFNEYGITLSPKATLIEDCTIYSVTKTIRRINGKCTKGYILSK